MSRRFIRASARELRQLQERPLDDAEWLVLVLDGKTFSGDQHVVALGVPATGEKWILGLVQTASENKRVIAAFLGELGERGFPLSSLCWSCSTTRRVCGRWCATSSVTGSRCSGVNGTSRRMW